MGLEKCTPGRPFARLGRGFNTVAFQNVGDRTGRRGVAEIRKCALHPIVAPRWILSGHPQNQLGDLPRDWRPAWSPPSVRPLASNETAIPGKERIRRHQIGDFLMYLSSERPAFNSRRRRWSSDKCDLWRHSNHHPSGASASAWYSNERLSGKSAHRRVLSSFLAERGRGQALTVVLTHMDFD